MNPDDFKGNRGGPAFPGSNQEIDSRNPGWIGGGLSMRDYFAAKAMQALLNAEPDRAHKYIAIEAYFMADAMLAAREAA